MTDSFLLQMDILMTKLVEFMDGGRTFVCRAESSPATPGTLWWWMSVSGESSRYAAFRFHSGDTAPTLRPRILAYYAQLLADRERPPIHRQHWSERRAAQKALEGEGSTANPGTLQPRAASAEMSDDLPAGRLPATA